MLRFYDLVIEATAELEKCEEIEKSSSRVETWRTVAAKDKFQKDCGYSMKHFA